MFFVHKCFQTTSKAFNNIYACKKVTRFWIDKLCQWWNNDETQLVQKFKDLLPVQCIHWHAVWNRGHETWQLVHWYTCMPSSYDSNPEATQYQLSGGRWGFIWLASHLPVLIFDSWAMQTINGQDRRTQELLFSFLLQTSLWPQAHQKQTLFLCSNKTNSDTALLLLPEPSHALPPPIAFKAHCCCTLFLSLPNAFADHCRRTLLFHKEFLCKEFDVGLRARSTRHKTEDKYRWSWFHP